MAEKTQLRQLTRPRQDLFFRAPGEGAKEITVRPVMMRVVQDAWSASTSDCPPLGQWSFSLGLADAQNENRLRTLIRGVGKFVTMPLPRSLAELLRRATVVLDDPRPSNPGAFRLTTNPSRSEKIQRFHLTPAPFGRRSEAMLGIAKRRYRLLRVAQGAASHKCFARQRRQCPPRFQ